jgi:hypothetical protein
MNISLIIAAGAIALARLEHYANRRRAQMAKAHEATAKRRP